MSALTSSSESRTHVYATRTEWTGNDGEGTRTYRSYRRDHTLEAPGKAPILASSDPQFRGEASRYNPEELLIASLSSCHMLWYLHVCAVNGVNVVAYLDSASGELETGQDGSGQFSRVVLHPKVTISAGSDKEKALALHEEAHRFCFIARSVNFPVEIEAEILTA